MDDIDREILAGIGKPRARVAIVPTASGLEDTPPSWVALAQTHFAALGADVVPVMVVRREDARERKWIDAVWDVDWVYFSGGRPQHAIDVLAGTPFWEEVLRLHGSGAVLAGSSAGAMMLGEKSYAPDDFDAAGLPQRVSVRDGLGVLGGHFVVPALRSSLAAFPRAPSRVDRGMARGPARDRHRRGHRGRRKYWWLDRPRSRQRRDDDLIRASGRARERRAFRQYPNTHLRPARYARV